jgi:hypothetical protein
MTKTFKIGEYCMGGIITVTIKKDIKIECKDWDSKKVISMNTYPIKKYDHFEKNVVWQIDDYLNDLTSSYYAEQVMEYIKSKADIGYKEFNF